MAQFAILHSGRLLHLTSDSIGLRAFQVSWGNLRVTLPMYRIYLLLYLLKLGGVPHRIATLSVPVPVVMLVILLLLAHLTLVVLIAQCRLNELPVSALFLQLADDLVDGRRVRELASVGQGAGKRGRG